MGALPREGAFKVVSVNVSRETGTRKRPVPGIALRIGLGVAGDAHAGLCEDRQVSLLAVEEIEGANARLCPGYGETGRPAAGLSAAAEGGADARGAAGDPHGPGAAQVRLVPGDFAENITTAGIALHELPVGTRLEIGGAVLEVSKIGKECHASCEIRRLVGDCVMPRKGIFARVLAEGEISDADSGHYRF